jgi:hypothetical protein|tara:strand:- start:477 stop:650 length:174 start_codon:yes stop_codon:yes gene_type:complete
MNTILYIGLGLMLVGFVGFLISAIMERHYEIKLWKHEQLHKSFIEGKKKEKQQWQKK